MTKGGAKVVLRLSGAAENGIPGPARCQHGFRA